jgi:hypothetical protein
MTTRLVGRRILVRLRTLRCRTGRLARGQPQRHPVRHDPRLVDVVGRHHQCGVVDDEGDAALRLIDRFDATLQATTVFLRQLQGDLGRFAKVTTELLQVEQRAIHARRRHFQRVIAADRVFDVHLCGHFAAYPLTVVHIDDALRLFRQRHVDVKAKGRTAGGRQILNAQQLQAQRHNGRGEQIRDVGCLVAHSLP